VEGQRREVVEEHLVPVLRSNHSYLSRVYLLESFHMKFDHIEYFLVEQAAENEAVWFLLSVGA
jgi:hypothetical protein